MYVTTQQNDTLDGVCFRAFARTDMISAVIASNPHALHTPILPAGMQIHLPDEPVPQQTEKITLWD